MPPRDSAPGLGPQLLRRRDDRFSNLAGGLAIVLLLLPLVVLFIQPIPLWQRLGAIVGAMGMSALLYGLFLVRIDIHEGGLVRSSLLGRRELAFQDVAVFTLSAARVSLNGIYATHHYDLRFEPAPGRGKPIRFFVEQRGGDRHVERLCEAISSRMAERLRQQLEQTGRVPWCGMELSREGVRYRAEGKTLRLLPLADLRWALEDGELRLHTVGQQEPLLRQLCGAPNFHPGFTLLRQLGARPLQP